MTSNPLFGDKNGLGNGFPWTQPPAGRAIEYDPAEYPMAAKMLDTSICVGSALHPLFVQPREVMEGYVEAFRKVLADPRRLIDS